MAPKARERFLGYAEIRKVFDITKAGKVAGCMVTEGVVKRGAGVRLLRDGVVIHTGELTQLKRFKDDVREVARGYECGLSFANFHDLQRGRRGGVLRNRDGAGLRHGGRHVRRSRRRQRQLRVAEEIRHVLAGRVRARRGPRPRAGRRADHRDRGAGRRRTSSTPPRS